MFYYLIDILKHSLRRLLDRKGTTLTAIAGLTLALSLILSISLYADGIYFRTFLENVAKTRENPEHTISDTNPTFTFLFHYFGGWHGTKTWEELLPLDEYFIQDGVRSLGIPSIDLVRLFGTNTFYLFPQDPSAKIDQLQLSRIHFGVLNDIEKHATLSKGRFPKVLEYEDNGPIEALVNKNLANKAGIKIDQEFEANFKTQTDSGTFETHAIPVVVVGIWEPTDPAEDYWIFAPSYYESYLFIPEETFFERIGTRFPDLVYNAYWYLIMDANYVHADEVGGLLNRINRMEREANLIQENLWLSISPKEALQNFADEARILRILLYAFSVPIVGLAVAFIGLVSRLSTEQRRREIAVLRSRGATVAQILGFTALDGVILGAIAFGMSIPISKWVTQIIGATGGFLDFSASTGMRVAISQGAVRIGAFSVGVFLVMLLLPTRRASQHTITSYKSEQARTVRAPWWQRIWLDVLLFIPAAYGAYMLQKQGGLAVLNNETSGDPFQNPLLFLVPSLGILALSLFSLRLIRPVMAAIDRLTSLTPSVGLTLASRNISRQPRNYFTPLLILTLTMSLFAYTASLMSTLDQALYDQEYYKIGADAQFFDPGDSSTAGGSYRWDFFPVDEYARSEGVQSAARLGRYSAEIKTARLQAKGLFLGIDRLSFPKAAYWREDFADQDLGALMNALAKDPANVLVNAEFLEDNGLRIGDSVRATVKTFNTYSDLSFKVTGSFDYFPTWYPESGPVLVGNLENLFATAGGAYPYYVLLDIEDGVDPLSIESDKLRAMDERVRPVDWETPAQLIAQAQGAPERQGLLGFLFIGFIAAALLTVLAFLLHLTFTFQKRSIETSVLRASGLSMVQMTATLIWEFAFLIIFGGAVGTGLGLFASRTFIPYLQIGDGQAAMIPPFQVYTPWDSIIQIYGLFGVLFGISLIASVISLRRMRIFEAIKLGETV